MDQGQKPLDGPVLQLSFIQKVKKNTSSRREGMQPKRQGEKRGPRPNFGSSFYTKSLKSVCILLVASSIWTSYLTSAQ